MSKVGQVRFGRLAEADLRRKPFWTGVLITIVGVLTVAFFSTSFLSISLHQGLENLKLRMGADLMVVPKGANEAAEGAILGAGPQTFYFDRSIEDKIRHAKGVKQVTSQTFISSLSAPCCAYKVQIIGFDPKTDFVIEPWIATQYDGKLKTGDVITGSSVFPEANGKIKLFNNEFPVVAQLAETGTNLDNSVFVNQETAHMMIRYAQEVNHPVKPSGNIDDIISTVLINVDTHYRPQRVMEFINRIPQLKDVGVIYPADSTSRLKMSLSGVTLYVSVSMAVLWVIGLVILVAVFSSSANERKKEFASLRVIGATKAMLRHLVAKEALMVGTAGGIGGIVVALAVLYPFTRAIRNQLGMPYLQASPLQSLIIGVVCLVGALVVSLLAGTLSVTKMLRTETYLTLRQGE